MNGMDSTVTFRNLINIIDRTVLDLKRVRKGQNFSLELKRQIINILNFIIETKAETYSDALYNKGVFIERESLEIFRINLLNLHISEQEIKKITLNIQDWDCNNIDEINEIQSILIKVSIPIWETTQKIKNG